ncbi:ABC transporter permease [Azorhizobium oxalatiphilum]|uniref:ABC transporter permease n=1 Tax=Azorhizobium oxalatiphilum TaxID=980631 RepID=A0A917CAD0_9HYPH|nr:ABC transporter permease [Azorhizobium oxalatiphilum]GGF80928.1 ABC transporter permease [Azorhizobium oxalatiphilum]
MINRLATLFAWAMAIGAALFLLAPLIVIAAASFSPTPVFDLPVDGASLRWYTRIGQMDGFWPALSLSLQLAAFSTLLALVLGTLAAIAIAQGRLPGAEAIGTFLVSPLMMPGLVLGIALLQYFRMVGFNAAWSALLLAHLVVTLPYVARTMIAGLSRFDFTLVEAARTLGCTYPGAILKVMVPALAPSFLTAGLFSFLASFDNYPVSIFLTDVRTKTLPIKMLQYIEEAPDPTLAALSTCILAATVVLLIASDRLVGLHRMAGTGQ